MILLPKLPQQVLCRLTLPVRCVLAWGAWPGGIGRGQARASCPGGLHSQTAGAGWEERGCGMNGPPRQF